VMGFADRREGNAEAREGGCVLMAKSNLGSSGSGSIETPTNDVDIVPFSIK